jgi:hypothetical protein
MEGRRKHLLCLGRSGLGQSGAGREHDSDLARLMPWLSERDFARVLRQMEDSASPPDGFVRFHLEVDGPTRELLARAALEIRRAHGRNLEMEEILDYLLQIEERGAWPEIPGRPFPERGSLGTPSLTRRLGPPRSAAATFECARCELVWQVSSTGDLLFPDPDRVEELAFAAGAPGRPRVRLLSRRHDPDPAAPSRSQPHPRAERGAIERDGGCRVPGCPHGRDGRPGLLRAVALCQLAPRLAGAHGALSRDEQGRTRFDLRGVETEHLITLCAGHLRAVARGALAVDMGATGLAVEGPLRWRGGVQARARPLDTTSEVPVVQRLTSIGARAQLDLEELLERIASLEAAAPPPGGAARVV